MITVGAWMVLSCALFHSLFLPPPIRYLFPLISWCMAAKQAQTDPTSLPFSVICHSFPLSGETAAAATVPIARAICLSLGRPRCALTTPFIHFHPRNHPQRERERPRGRLLRPPSSTDSCMHNKAGPPKPNRRSLHTALRPMTATAT